MSRWRSRLRDNRLVRALLAPANRRLAHHDAQLAVHEQAIADILPALQEVQGPRLAALREAADDLDRRLAQVEQHLPALLNTISSSAVSHRRLERQLVEYAEWSVNARAEILYELRYGGGGSGTDVAAREVEVRVVDPDKLEAARAGGLRLNLGCGHLPLEGYVNVDMRELPGVDVVAPVDRLPVEAGEVVELFSSHVFEHFPEQQLVRTLLPYWRSLLRPGGELRAVVPDLEAMARGLAAGEIPYEDFREVTYGGQEYEGDFHFNMFSPASLGRLLADAGFVDIEVEAEARRNGKCLEFQMVARTPA